MVAPIVEQRNPYAGDPVRPWIFVMLEGKDGQAKRFKLIADTGNPFAIILGSHEMPTMNRGEAPSIQTNFGLIDGMWVKLAMPELGLTHKILGYVSDEVYASAKVSGDDFAGLAGLPFLSLLEYGGNANEFWIRPLKKARRVKKPRKSNSGSDDAPERGNP